MKFRTVVLKFCNRSVDMLSRKVANKPDNPSVRGIPANAAQQSFDDGLRHTVELSERFGTTGNNVFVRILQALQEAFACSGAGTNKTFKCLVSQTIANVSEGRNQLIVCLFAANLPKRPCCGTLQEVWAVGG